MVIFFDDGTGIAAVGSSSLVKIRLIDEVILIKFNDIDFANDNAYSKTVRCVLRYDNKKAAAMEFKAFQNAVACGDKSFTFQEEKVNEKFNELDLSWEYDELD